MNLRILSFAALTGMLAAAGCGGGTGSGIAPTVGNSTGGTGSTTSTARGTISASFNIPARYVATTTSSSTRKPAYISPGSSGIEVLLGNSSGTLNSTTGATWIVGHSGAPLALTGSPGTSFSGNTLTSATVGYQSGAAVSYSYQPSSTLANYYTFTLSITGLQLSTALPLADYSIGVVLTDLTNNNFILSEAQAYTTLTSSSLITPVTMTLLPVVDKAYLAGPTLIPTAVGTVPALSYEYTLYAEDELGYVIPSGTGSINTFDGQSLTVGEFPAVSSPTINVGQPTTVTTLTFGTGTTNPVPATATGAFSLTTTAITTPGTLVTIAAPAGGLSNQPPAYRSASPYTAGVPITVTSNAATGIVGVSAYLTAAATGTVTGLHVSGYTYTPGTNFPTGGTYAVGTASSVNYTPGIYPIIQ